MFGIRFVKFQPTTYVFRIRKGQVVQEGMGLSFFYYAPTTSLVAIPVTSVESPFMFEEVTADFQAITLQGQVTWRIADPARLSKLLNYTLDPTGRTHLSEDPQKLPQRLVNVVQVLTRKSISGRGLREALAASDALVAEVSTGLKADAELQSLGVEVLGLAVLAIRPNKDTARALEAEAREQLLKEADDAIYRRRNASVEQERRIKENELNTEIAVEQKRRQIRETQMEAERAVQEKQQALEAARMTFSIEQEREKQHLVETRVQNVRAEADASAYTLAATMKALHGMDPAVIQALAGMGMQPKQLIAQAFQGLAGRAEKIGELNVSPELLKELLQR